MERGSRVAFRRKGPTLRDVARLAGTAVITASRVINGATYVSDETRRKVTEAVQELGYRPNAMARGLVTRRSLSVGVIVSDITNPFSPHVIRGIEDALHSERYHVVLADTDGDPARGTEALGWLLEKQVDGLILCASGAPGDELVRAVEMGVPVVLINRAPPDRRAGAVLVEARAASRRAVEHLLSLEHRRIACIRGPETSWSSRERVGGYLDALSHQGIEADPELIIEARSTTAAGGEEALDRLLSGRTPPTAIFAFNDLVAVGALRRAQGRGIRVPRDLAIVGFDDIELASLVDPPLTTVRQPKYRMGFEAGDMMLGMLAGHLTVEQTCRRLDGELVIRRSSGGQAVRRSARRRPEPGAPRARFSKSRQREGHGAGTQEDR